ncbi:MAG: alcohol dehydrogenase catalytic domain-containing protein [Nitrospinota bacterium]
MKAMVLREVGKPLLYENMETPKPGPGEALVRVRACGVCHTDHGIWEGKVKVSLPHIMGHEGAGEVVELGPSAAGVGPEVKVGDRCAIYCYITCGACPKCLDGRENICENFGGRIGFEVPGSYAEFVKVPAANCIKIPDGVSFEQATLFPDALCTPYHGLVRRGRLRAGEDVVILGVGGLGIHGVQVAKALGARVIAVDIDEGKLKKAREFGASSTINAAQEETSEAILRETSGRGAHLILEGVAKRETLEASLKALRRGGRLVMMGYVAGSSFSVEQDSLLLGEHDIMGTLSICRADMLEVMELVADRRIIPQVVEEYPLEEANRALQGFDSRGPGRAILKC